MQSAAYRVRLKYPEKGDDDDVFVVVEGSLTGVVDVTAESPLSLALAASAPDLVSAVM